MRPLGVGIFVYNIDSLAGMERQARLLANRLAARGCHVTIVSSVNIPEGRCLGLPRLYERLGSLEILRIPFFPFGSYDATERLYQVVAAHVVLRRRRKLDVYYGVQYTSGRHAARVARILARPVCLKFAGGGRMGDFTDIARRACREEILDELRRVDRCVCLSTQIADEARAVGLDPARFRSIPNGVDLSTPAPAAREERVPGRLIFVGRLDGGKMVDTLLSAVASLAPRWPSLELEIIGEGPSAPELEALASSLGITSRVRFLGRRTDVLDRLRRSSIFVLPSASEGISNALLEALATGTPVVATNIPGTNEVVRHEEEALLVPVGDPVALGAALERLLSDHGLAHRLGQAGHARVRREFDIERVADRYLSLFREALAGSGTARRSVDYASLFWLHARYVREGFPFFLGPILYMITQIVVGTKALLGIKGRIL